MTDPPPVQAGLCQAPQDDAAVVLTTPASAEAERVHDSSLTEPVAAPAEPEINSASVVSDAAGKNQAGGADLEAKPLEQTKPLEVEPLELEAKPLEAKPLVAKPLEPSGDGQTALMVAAAEAEDWSAVEGMLREPGDCDPNARTTDWGYSLIRAAAEEGEVEVCRCLLLAELMSTRATKIT